MPDGKLLQSYVRDSSEAAFAELVGRHLNLVYSAALRQVNADAHLAEDVTQAVFADLARNAHKLIQHTSLAGWLYTSTRYVAANVRRTEQRRSHRETEAHAMNSLLSQPEPQPDWLQLRPLLDQAMHALDEADREAVLLRHFQNCSYAEVGQKIGLTENAARMRVDRALEKLRAVLEKQGATLTTVALAGLIGTNAVMAAPASLAAKVVAGALAGAAATGAGYGLTGLISAILKSKAALGFASIALVATVGLLIVAHSRDREPGRLSADKPALSETNSTVAAALTTSNGPENNIRWPAPMPARAKDPLTLHLKIVAADSGKPIPIVPIEYRAWADGKYAGSKTFTSTRLGECEVDYPTNTTLLELTTRKDGIADTRLLWRPTSGDVIPTNYLLRVDWPVAISGTVEDDDGKPVAGAEVGWSHQENPATVKQPQSHEFSRIITTTDADGKWRINRIAEEVISEIGGMVRHPDYAGPVYVEASRAKQLLPQLVNGTHVFKLVRTIPVSGMVQTEMGYPVSGAKVFTSVISDSGGRDTTSADNGTFLIKASRSGKELITADAPGFAPTTIEVDITDNTEPVRLVLKSGKTLRIKVADIYGTPIPGAQLWYDCINNRNDRAHGLAVQLEFNRTTDPQGLIVYTNAPDCEMRFRASAKGFQNVQDIYIRPDGVEHVITLKNALVVHGQVRDADTHQPIPKFRIVQGWPERNSMNNTTNARWSTIDRFWLNFSGGVYSNTFEEAALGGTPNRGYLLKFIADGYQPFISRIIDADEGNVELNVDLPPAQTTEVTVFAPSGKRAVNDDVGFVSPGSRLVLVPGGFSMGQGPSAGARVHLEKNGTFELDNDPTITRVIVAGPDGYVEATPAELAANPQMQLQPWGRLEVTVYSGGQLPAGCAYGLRYGGGSTETVAFDFMACRFTTDAQGKFQIDQLPPGKHELVQLRPQNSLDGRSVNWVSGNKTPFEIRAGETTRLDVGISNCTVTAHLQWPAGMVPQPKENISAQFYTHMPEIPREIRTNRPALMEFRKTDEYQKAMKNQRFLFPTVDDNGLIAIDDVEPGEYQLVVGVRPPEIRSDSPQNDNASSIIRSRRPIASATKSVSVPGGRPLDIGVLELKIIPPAQQP